jgi:hypothetical protein
MFATLTLNSVDCTVEVRSKRHDGCERDPPHMLQTYHYSNPACPGRHYGTREKCQRIDRAYKPVVHILKVVSTASIKPELPVFQCSSSINEDCPLCEAERDSEVGSGPIPRGKELTITQIEEDFQSSPSHFPPVGTLLFHDEKG